MSNINFDEMISNIMSNLSETYEPSENAGSDAVLMDEVDEVVIDKPARQAFIEDGLTDEVKAAAIAVLENMAKNNGKAKAAELIKAYLEGDSLPDCNESVSGSLYFGKDDEICAKDVAAHKAEVKLSFGKVTITDKDSDTVRTLVIDETKDAITNFTKAIRAIGKFKVKDGLPYDVAAFLDFGSFKDTALEISKDDANGMAGTRVTFLKAESIAAPAKPIFMAKMTGRYIVNDENGKIICAVLDGGKIGKFIHDNDGNYSVVVGGKVSISHIREKFPKAVFCELKGRWFAASKFRSVHCLKVITANEAAARLAEMENLANSIEDDNLLEADELKSKVSAKARILTMGPVITIGNVNAVICNDEPMVGCVDEAYKVAVMGTRAIYKTLNDPQANQHGEKDKDKDKDEKEETPDIDSNGAVLTKEEVIADVEISDTKSSKKDYATGLVTDNSGFSRSIRQQRAAMIGDNQYFLNHELVLTANKEVETSAKDGKVVYETDDIDPVENDFVEKFVHIELGESAAVTQEMMVHLYSIAVEKAIEIANGGELSDDWFTAKHQELLNKSTVITDDGEEDVDEVFWRIAEISYWTLFLRYARRVISRDGMYDPTRPGKFVQIDATIVDDEGNDVEAYYRANTFADLYGKYNISYATRMSGTADINGIPHVSQADIEKVVGKKLGNIGRNFKPATKTEESEVEALLKKICHLTDLQKFVILTRAQRFQDGNFYGDEAVAKLIYAKELEGAYAKGEEVGKKLLHSKTNAVANHRTAVQWALLTDKDMLAGPICRLVDKGLLTTKSFTANSRMNDKYGKPKANALASAANGGKVAKFAQPQLDNSLAFVKSVGERKIRPDFHVLEPKVSRKIKGYNLAMVKDGITKSYTKTAKKDRLAMVSKLAEIKYGCENKDAIEHAIRKASVAPLYRSWEFGGERVYLDAKTEARFIAIETNASLLTVEENPWLFPSYTRAMTRQEFIDSDDSITGIKNPKAKLAKDIEDVRNEIRVVRKAERDGKEYYERVRREYSIKDHKYVTVRENVPITTEVSGLKHREAKLLASYETYFGKYDKEEKVAEPRMGGVDYGTCSELHNGNDNVRYMLQLNVNLNHEANVLYNQCSAIGSVRVTDMFTEHVEEVRNAVVIDVPVTQAFKEASIHLADAISACKVVTISPNHMDKAVNIVGGKHTNDKETINVIKALDEALDAMYMVSGGYAVK